MLDDLTAALDEQKRELAREGTSLAATDLRGDAPLMDPDSGCGRENDEPAILTVVAQDGVSLQEMFKLNDW